MAHSPTPPTVSCTVSDSSNTHGGHTHPLLPEEATQHVEGDEADDDLPVVGGEGGEYGTHLAWGDKKGNRLANQDEVSG